MKLLRRKSNLKSLNLMNIFQKSSLLVKKCEQDEPDYVELCAAGSILQSFYNGIENILLVISKNIDKKTPNQGKWHSELLLSMCKEAENRSAVFSESLYPILLDYMNFRHFFRHSYGYSMKWEKLSHLFLDIENNWDKIKNELFDFISK